MNAMEKAAWTELVASLAAIAVVAALYPWFGFNATRGFALLALALGGMWFLRRRGKAVVVDERDRAIQQHAIQSGTGAAWMALLLSVIALGSWSRSYNDGIVRTYQLTWLVWLQFTVYVGVRGLVGVLAYRRQRQAA